MPFQELGILADRNIDESSGLARCLARPGMFWTHNDSGSGANLYLINDAGKTIAVYQVQTKAARDWEDMCSFCYGRQNYLLIGDVGDNAARRDVVHLLLIKEPDVSNLAEAVHRQLPVERTFTFRYPDGPRDCEALAVDPATGAAYRVSKEIAMHCSVYELRSPGTKIDNGAEPHRTASGERSSNW